MIYDNQKVYFDTTITQNDIDLLCADTGDFVYIKNNFYFKDRITEFTIASAQNVKTIGDGFLGYWRNLSKLNLEGLASVTNINGTFLARCEKLQELNLSSWINLTNITCGYDPFLEGTNTNLKFYVPLRTPPVLNGEWDQNALSGTNAKIICGNFLSSYQSADVWKEKSSKMSAN